MYLSLISRQDIHVGINHLRIVDLLNMIFIETQSCKPHIIDLTTNIALLF